MKYDFVTSLEKFESNLWGFHLRVPSNVAEVFLANNCRRVVCQINNAGQIHCALMPSGNHWFILVNKKIRESLSLRIGDSVRVSLEEDTSEYGMPMPEELAVLLEQDEEGSNLFQALTPGKQRSLIHIVSKVKNVDSRINKALAILHHLKESSGKIDFKRLHQTIKEYNQRTRPQ